MPVIDPRPLEVIQSGELITARPWSLQDSGAIVDAGANLFVSTMFVGGNETYAVVLKVAPGGGVVGQWAVVAPNGWKIDSSSLTASGNDLLVITTSHSLPNPMPPEGRWSATGVARIPGVFEAFGNQLPGAGADGAFVPSGSGGGGGGGDPVDYDRIEQIVVDQIAAFKEQFGGGPAGNVRRGISEKVQDAMVELVSTPSGQNPRVQPFQDNWYSFNKNAAANPLANVLAGSDEWGQARRDELKSLIREVLDEWTEDGELEAEPTEDEEEEIE